MELSSVLGQAGYFFSSPHLLLMVGGILPGIIFGVLSGLAGPQILALLLPATFGMDMYSARILLLSASASTLFSGSITTIFPGVFYPYKHVFSKLSNATV